MKSRNIWNCNISESLIFLDCENVKEDQCENAG